MCLTLVFLIRNVIKFMIFSHFIPSQIAPWTYAKENSKIPNFSASKKIPSVCLLDFSLELSPKENIIRSWVLKEIHTKIEIKIFPLVPFTK